MPLHSNTTLYEPGDVVRVRDDLVSTSGQYDNYVYYRMSTDRNSKCIANDDMIKLRGQPVTIKEFVTNGGIKYRIYEDGGLWNWTDEMFSGYAEEETIPVPNVDYDSFDWVE